MSQEKEEKRKLIGFLSLSETQTHDAYMGAILITDLQGIPQEFRCTHPVRPTNIQKPLYGNTLLPYIGVHLCGIPIMQSVQNKPSFVLVNKQFLMDVRTGYDCPIIFIRKAGEAIDIESSQGDKMQSPKVIVDCSNGKYQPISLTCPLGFNDVLSSAKDILKQAFNY